jgi:hypothetical protein
VFKSNIWDTKTNDCLQQAGYTQPGELVPLMPDQRGYMGDLAYPDIPLYDSGHFTVPPLGPPAPPLPAMTPAQAAAYQSTLAACRQSSNASEIDTVLHEFAPLLKLWNQAFDISVSDPSPTASTPVVQSTDPAVTQAYEQALACAHAAGYPVPAIEQMIPSDVNGPDPSPADAQIARDFGRCDAPLAAAMDQVRLARRQQLIDQNETTLAQLQTDMDAAIQKLSAEYGVPWPGTSTGS